MALSQDLNKAGLQDAQVAIATGNFDKNVHLPPPPQLPTFVRMIVIDVISDPNSEIDFNKQAIWDAQKVMNMKYANVLPRNTIIAKKVNEDSPPMFVFPFFPSHLAFPCKAGEMVWVMFENPSAKHSDIAYWFCRITEPHHVDDVNHSHPGRYFEPSMFPGAEEKFKNEKAGKAESGENFFHELRNGPVVRNEKERYTSHTNLILRGEDEDIFETLIAESDAGLLTSYESVPRYRKRPGDVVFEGSNNSLIVLGTDRQGPVASYELDPELSTPIPKFPANDFSGSAGCIDIVVGRGQTDETYGESADTTSIKGTSPGGKGPPLKKELNKSPGATLSPTEGDPDLKNDRSRILISQRTSVDKNLNISGYNKKIDDTKNFHDSPEGDPAIVIKTDKLRFVARSDIEILVTNYDEATAPDGRPRKDESDDTSEWASIVIKSNGDIVMKPSKSGFIKLGDETANRALLCTGEPVSSVSLGKVSKVDAKLVINNTMGGQIGVPGLKSTGTWAKKILVTGADAPDESWPERGE